MTSHRPDEPTADIAPLPRGPRQPSLRPPGGRSSGPSWARRIIMPLVILVVAGMILLWTNRREAERSAEVEQAVTMLLKEIARDRPTAHPPMIQRLQPGRGVIEQLEAIVLPLPRDLPGLEVQILIGDETPPYGDGTATHRARITLHGRLQLVLRIVHPDDPEQIRIVGYARPEAFP